MIPSSDDIIDLSSDSEDDIIDLCSDNEENSDFRSDRADDLDYEDPDNDFNRPCVSLSTSDQNNLEQPINLEGDYLFSSTQASSCCRPVDRKSTTTAMSSEVPNPLLPVNHGSSAGMPHESTFAIPDDQCNDAVGKLYACNDYKGTLPLLLTNGAPAKSEHFDAPSGAPYDSVHVNGQHIYDAEALYACNINNRILPLLLTNGAAANSGHSHIPQFPQSVTREIPRSFSPQSFASSHPIFSDNKIKEESTMKLNGFQRSSTNGNGTSSSTVPTGDTL
jgi:hypothetical protein